MKTTPPLRKCIYAGSFDPLTKGHFWMIQEASKLFDELVVAIGVNPQKKSSYPLDLRLQMMKEALQGLENVSVTSFSGQFLVDFATTHNAGFILRGIRGETDFEYERGMRYINDKINPDLSTVFLIPPKYLSETSSSMVRGLMGPPGWTHIVKEYLPEAVFKSTLRFELQKQFVESFSNLNPDSTRLESVAEELTTKYSEPQRHYHTLTHIAECLAELQTIPLDASSKTKLELAIWFHDAIYDPKSKSNEEDSAKYFAEKARTLGCSQALTQEVSAYILATKTHDAGKERDRLLEYFLDIDLSILGSDTPRFVEYSEGIRAEYAWVPSLLYGPKRKKILKSFLERPVLFLTPEFRERYEARARSNLKRAVGKESSN